jgi:SAM-dependent methyltransferase
MFVSHFSSLRPVCPNCRARGKGVGLRLAVVEEQQGDDVVSGIVSCDACGAEYPVIDGLPILVPDVRRYVQDNLYYLLARDDLPPAVESLIGDASGPGSMFESARQHLSSYVWDHWGEFDPEERPPACGGARPGAVARGLDAARAQAGDDLPEGPILDVGCGAGRSVHEAAKRHDRIVLGIDLGSSLARAARRAVVGGQVDYSRRRIGLTYDRRRFGVPPSPEGRADIWICDVLSLPFADESFALVVGMNVLDCLGNPRDGLVELDRVLARGGEAVLTVPFDWSAAVTPVESWIGGHSQRGPHRGSGETILDHLLTDGPLAAGSLRRKSSTTEIPWHVRLHERSCMHYQTYGIAARRG